MYVTCWVQLTTAGPVFEGGAADGRAASAAGLRNAADRIEGSTATHVNELVHGSPGALDLYVHFKVTEGAR